MQRMRNNDECMLGGVMEEKRGMVRAVPLAGGRSGSPGRVRSSARVLVMYGALLRRLQPGGEEETEKGFGDIDMYV